MQASRHKKIKLDKYSYTRSLEDPLNLQNAFPDSKITKNYLIKDPVIIPPVLNVKDPLNLQHDIDKEEKKFVSKELSDIDILKKSLNITSSKPHLKTRSVFNKVRNYAYGNYPSYYKYRNKNVSLHKYKDPRLIIFQKEWIYQKKILDIGCNTGFLTRCLAKTFQPLKVTGIDIDSSLIKQAHFDFLKELDYDKIYKKKPKINHNISKNYLFPVYTMDTKICYPYNLNFFTANYVIEDDKLLDLQMQEYDIILFLSISKWIHLNWGDNGIKLTFQRIFRQLNDQGLFIFEPQEWLSYKKAKKKTKKDYTHFQFRPSNFKSYLLNEVGFSYVKAFYPPKASSVGFERTIYVYLKSTRNNVQKCVKELCLDGGEYAVPSSFS